MTEKPSEKAVRRAIEAAVSGADLTVEQARAAFEEILSGSATPAQIAGLLVALRAKGETLEEVVGAARAMRDSCVKIRTGRKPLLDTCGTGGDGKSTLNISTLAALVVGAAGTAVAKHGNRSVTSSCGSADLLQALGVKVDADPKNAERCLEKIGFAFLFAPIFHPAMKQAAPVRRELGIRTLFNLLGPLTNPASPTHQVVGVYDPERMEQVAATLSELGCERSLVVHGEEGFDEVSLSGDTAAVLRHGKKARRLKLNPKSLGFQSCRASDLRVADLNDAVRAAREVLSGGQSPKRDAVALNACCALALVRADFQSFADAVPEIRPEVERILDEGLARRKLEELVEMTGGAAA